MALTQSERISLSKKIISIPEENSSASQSKDALNKQQAIFQQQDSANKSIMDVEAALIGQYQSELSYLDGNVRTVVVEQNLIDSAKRIKLNFFFPNDIQTPTPSITDGIWKNFVPFSKNIAIGKNYQEVFGSTIDKESDFTDDISTIVAIVEGLSDPIRSTGRECIPDTGSCSLPIYTDQVSCESNSGVWTPPSGMDSFIPSAAAQAALVDATNFVNTYKAYLITLKSNIVTDDYDVARQAANNIAIANIDTTIAAIDTWLAYDDFDTTTIPPNTCPLFDVLTADDFEPSKLRLYELDALNAAISSRLSYSYGTRAPQVSSTLGSVVQSSTGAITGGSGLYLKRFIAIDTRLNAINGTLTKVVGMELGKRAQDETIQSNNLAESLYDQVMVSAKFKAPASNTGTIHVTDSTDFEAGDSVWIVGDGQAEISTTILSKAGNAIFLSSLIPQKYTHNNNSRIYKEL